MNKIIASLAAFTMLWALHFDPDRKLCRFEEGILIPNPDKRFATTKEIYQRVADQNHQMYCRNVQLWAELYL